MRVWKRGEKQKGRQKDIVRRRERQEVQEEDGNRGRGVDNTRKETES